jgi:hypothetical protein
MQDITILYRVYDVVYICKISRYCIGYRVYDVVYICKISRYCIGYRVYDVVYARYHDIV